MYGCIYITACTGLIKNKPTAETGVMTARRDGFGGSIELPTHHRCSPTDLQGSYSQKETENARRKHCFNTVGIILYYKRVSISISIASIYI